MRKTALTSMFFLTALLAAGAARAEPCQDYNRTVDFADGTARQAQGVACMDEDGVWRVTQENLVPLAAPLPPEVYYAPPRYYPAPRYYDPYYAPYSGPYAYPYYGPSLSFGFVFHDHGHDHWHHH